MSCGGKLSDVLPLSFAWAELPPSMTCSKQVRLLAEPRSRACSAFAAPNALSVPFALSLEYFGDASLNYLWLCEGGSGLLQL